RPREPALLERLDRLARAIELAERRERARRERIGLRLLHAAAPVQRFVREHDRLLVLPALEVDPRQLERRVRLGVVGSHRLAQLRDRAVIIAEITRGEPGQEARRSVVRPRPDTLLEL